MSGSNSRSVSPTAPMDSGSMSMSSDSKRTRKRRRQSETQAHRSQEKKRRQLINGSIVRLKELIPNSEGMRVTMVNVLQATETYIVELQAKQQALEAELAAFRSSARPPPPNAPTPSPYPIVSTLTKEVVPSSASPSPASLPPATPAFEPAPASPSPRAAGQHLISTLPELSIEPAALRMAVSKAAARQHYSPATPSLGNPFPVHCSPSYMATQISPAPALSSVDFLSPDVFTSFF